MSLRLIGAHNLELGFHKIGGHAANLEEFLALDRRVDFS